MRHHSARHNGTDDPHCGGPKAGPHRPRRGKDQEWLPASAG